MSKRTHGLDEREMELVKLLMADCRTTGDIQNKLKRLFAGMIEQMLEAEMDEHLGYEKNFVLGNNTGNSVMITAKRSCRYGIGVWRMHSSVYISKTESQPDGCR